MKAFLSILLLNLTISYAGQHKVLNPVIKNESQKLTHILFSGLPITEEIRVACHLLYAEQLLRSRSTSHLTNVQRINRAKICDLLHYYALRGEYPGNYKFPKERVPCFIDKNGTVCAVGYLIEQTEGLARAQLINEDYQYSDIYEMDVKFIEQWAEKNGLTAKEVAIIQPTYEWRKPVQKSTHLEILSSLRPAAELYLGFQLMRYQQAWGQSKFKLTGYGLSFEILKDGSCTGGIRALAATGNFRYLRPYLALNSDYYYTTSRGGGINLTPEVGLLSYLRISNTFKMTAQLSYGYHAGIVNKENYGPKRHDISLGVGIGVNW